MSSATDDRRDRLSLQTLVISSLSAGAAAIVVPLFWERGTLLATAITPVIVALVSEALRRPAERIRPRVTGRARQWLKRAVTTGLLAFAIAAVVLTASELSLFGGSVTGDGDTTLFDDSTTQREQDETPPSQQEPDATATPTPEATPTPTPTPDGEATPVPSPTPAAPAPLLTEPVP